MTARDENPGPGSDDAISTACAATGRDARQAAGDPTRSGAEPPVSTSTAPEPPSIRAAPAESVPWRTVFTASGLLLVAVQWWWRSVLEQSGLGSLLGVAPSGLGVLLVASSLVLGDRRRLGPDKPQSRARQRAMVAVAAAVVIGWELVQRSHTSSFAYDPADVYAALAGSMVGLGIAQLAHTTVTTPTTA